MQQNWVLSVEMVTCAANFEMLKFSVQNSAGRARFADMETNRVSNLGMFHQCASAIVINSIRKMVYDLSFLFSE